MTLSDYLKDGEVVAIAKEYNDTRRNPVVSMFDYLVLRKQQFDAPYGSATCDNLFRISAELIQHAKNLKDGD